MGIAEDIIKEEPALSPLVQDSIKANEANIKSIMERIESLRLGYPKVMLLAEGSVDIFVERLNTTLAAWVGLARGCPEPKVGILMLDMLQMRLDSSTFQISKYKADLEKTDKPTTEASPTV